MKMMQGMASRGSPLMQPARNMMRASPAAMTPLQAAAASFSSAARPKALDLAIVHHIDTHKVAAGQYNLDIRLNNQVDIAYGADTTLAAISEALFASKGNNIEKVGFFNMGGSKLPLSEKICNHHEYPVLLQINDNRTFAVNFSPDYRIEKRHERHLSIKEEEHYYDFARGIGYKGYELFSQSLLAYKLMVSLPPRQEMNKDDIAESVKTVLRYLHPKDAHETSARNFSGIKQRLDQLEAEVSAIDFDIE